MIDGTDTSIRSIHDFVNGMMGNLRGRYHRKKILVERLRNGSLKEDRSVPKKGKPSISVTLIAIQKNLPAAQLTFSHDAIRIRQKNVYHQSRPNRGQISPTWTEQGRINVENILRISLRRIQAWVPRMRNKTMK